MSRNVIFNKYVMIFSFVLAPETLAQLVVDSSCGDFACFAIKSDGSAYVWGLAGYGGDASGVDLSTNVADISCGGAACVARKTDGSALAWGDTSRGGSVPSRVDLSSNVADVNCGNYACVARKTDGSAFAWGSTNDGGDINVPTSANVDLSANIADISCGGQACVARKTDGSAYAWGDYLYGGDASGVDLSTNVADILCGGSSCVARKTDGSVVAWGSPTAGGSTSGVDVSSNVAEIGCGGNQGSACFAIKTDGSAVVWGYGPRGGDASSVDLSANVAQMSCGTWACAARKTDGSAYAWGHADYGGDASSVDLSANVVDIDCGFKACAARKSDGSVVVWGSADSGGDASSVDLSGNVADVDFGGHAAVARKTDGSAVVWGKAEWGGDLGAVDLSVPSPSPSPPPAPLPPTPPPSAVSVSFVLSGDVADYTADKQDIIKQVIATAAGVDKPTVTLELSPASVSVIATFHVADTSTATDLKTSLSASGALSSQSALQTALSNAGLSGVTVTSAPSLGWCCNPTGAFGDPHLAFAHGGKADFRGSHNDYYVFLSSPGYQFAPFFQEIDFIYATPTGLKQLVHGSFMTKASWFVLSGGVEYFLHMRAMYKGELVVLYDNENNGSYKNVIQLGPWSKRSFGGDLHIETKMLTVSVTTPTWSVNVTSKPIYGLVAPYNDATYESYHGKWEPNQRRLDIAIKGDYPQPDAHGIIGQSYQDDTVRNGKLDEYGVERSDVAHATTDGWLPPMTTSAQAEGAIEGVYTDYKLHADEGDGRDASKSGVGPKMYTHVFKFSRYKYPKRPKVANVDDKKQQQQRVAFSNEWEGRKKEL